MPVVPHLAVLSRHYGGARVMSVTLSFPHPVRAKAARQPPRMDDTVGLALTTLACVGAVAVILWGPLTGEAVPVTSAPQPCLSITDDGARLACYDKRVGRKPTPPAKGALAPPLTLPADRQ